MVFKMLALANLCLARLLSFTFRSAYVWSISQIFEYVALSVSIFNRSSEICLIIPNYIYIQLRLVRVFSYLLRFWYRQCFAIAFCVCLCVCFVFYFVFGRGEIWRQCIVCCCLRCDAIANCVTMYWNCELQRQQQQRRQRRRRQIEDFDERKQNAALLLFIGLFVFLCLLFSSSFVCPPRAHTDNFCHTHWRTRAFSLSLSRSFSIFRCSKLYLFYSRVSALSLFICLLPFLLSAIFFVLVFIKFHCVCFSLSFFLSIWYTLTFSLSFISSTRPLRWQLFPLGFTTKLEFQCSWTEFEMSLKFRETFKNETYKQTNKQAASSENKFETIHKHQCVQSINWLIASICERKISIFCVCFGFCFPSLFFPIASTSKPAFSEKNGKLRAQLLYNLRFDFNFNFNFNFVFYFFRRNCTSIGFVVTDLSFYFFNVSSLLSSAWGFLFRLVLLFSLHSTNDLNSLLFEIMSEDF